MSLLQKNVTFVNERKQVSLLTILDIARCSDNSAAKSWPPNIGMILYIIYYTKV